MPRYKLTIEYNGSAFRGSQRQSGGQRTVAGDLEEAVAGNLCRCTGYGGLKRAVDALKETSSET